MPSFQKLAALAALSVGAFAASDCPTTDDVTIDSVNPTFDCDVIDAKVTVSSSVQGRLEINGPKEFKQGLTVNGTSQLLGLSSSTLKKIGGTFTVQDANLLSSIDMPKLDTVSDVVLQRLHQLTQLSFGASGAEAESVDITDTFLSDLSGLKLAKVDKLTIRDNSKLAMFSSDLVNLTQTLIIVQNGDMQVNLTELETAYELQISNVKSLYTPALTTVQLGIKFSNNPNLESYEAANLTSVGTSKNGGSVTFIQNPKLQNVSFPVLETISGDLTMVNNTKLEEIAGFPELTTVSNMRLGGNFENATLPKLDDVKGTIKVTSTSNITDVCDFFNGLKKVVQGEVKCEGNLDKESANNQSLKGGSGKKGDGENASNVVGYSTAAVFVGLVSAFVQLL